MIVLKKLKNLLVQVILQRHQKKKKLTILLLDKILNTLLLPNDIFKYNIFRANCKGTSMKKIPLVFNLTPLSCNFPIIEPQTALTCNRLHPEKQGQNFHERFLLQFPPQI